MRQPGGSCPPVQQACLKRCHRHGHVAHVHASPVTLTHVHASPVTLTQGNASHVTVSLVERTCWPLSRGSCSQGNTKLKCIAGSARPSKGDSPPRRAAHGLQAQSIVDRKCNGCHSRTATAHHGCTAAAAHAMARQDNVGCSHSHMWTGWNSHLTSLG